MLRDGCGVSRDGRGEVDDSLQNRIDGRGKTDDGCGVSRDGFVTKRWPSRRRCSHRANRRYVAGAFGVATDGDLWGDGPKKLTIMRRCMTENI